MSKSLLFMICILTGLLVLACAKSETNKNTNAAATTSAASPATTANANHTASTGEKVGIEECDSFLTSYEHCVTSKIPEASRAQYQQSINTLRASWKKLADTPATRGTLANICKNQLETTKAQLKSFNCTF